MLPAEPGPPEVCEIFKLVKNTKISAKIAPKPSNALPTKVSTFLALSGSGLPRDTLSRFLFDGLYVAFNLPAALRAEVAAYQFAAFAYDLTVDTRTALHAKSFGRVGIFPAVGALNFAVDTLAAIAAINRVVGIFSLTIVTLSHEFLSFLFFHYITYLTNCH